jgi:hypothetical protein
MNSAIQASGLRRVWRYVGATRSNSASWAFDRLRLYYPDWFTKIGLFAGDHSDFYQTENGNIILRGEPEFGSQRFTSDNAFEHDFTFDLSSNTNNDLISIAISGIPKNADFQQIYCSPTGYSATRSKNAQIADWDFSIINTGVNVGGVNTSIFFDNQPDLSGSSSGNVLSWLDTSRTPVFYAKTLRFQNSNFYYDQIDKIIIWTERGGLSNGNLNYSGNLDNPSVASRAAYDALISRGWTITGNAPPMI